MWSYLIPLIILFLLLITYVIVVIVLDCHSNPTYTSKKNLNKQSIVTCQNLGLRGDMGNQIIQLATVIGASQSNLKTGITHRIILPRRTEKLPLTKLFDLSMYDWLDIKVDESFYEHNNYEKIVIPDNGKTYDIRGYRQCYKYFEEHASEVRKILTPRKELLDAVKKVVPKQYIALHIRNGYYSRWLYHVPYLEDFKRCQLDYYKEAVKKIRETYPNLPILVCTDDSEWVKTFINTLDSNITLAPTVDNISPKFSDFLVIYLAKAVIMSNSTYSWTATYLNPNRLVVCPTPWYDSGGLFGSAIALDGPYLHHPDWWLLDAKTGKLIRKPHVLDKNKKGERPDRQEQVLSIYKLIRGTLV